MKYLKRFDKFNLPFFKKNDPIKKEPIIEIPVSWIGSYTYNGKHRGLEIGDYTNKGIITYISSDIGFSFYTTDEGKFDTEDLGNERITVFKGNKDELDALIDSRKYNL